MIDLFSAESRRDPYQLYEQMRTIAPVVQEPRSGACPVGISEGPPGRA